MKHKSFFRNFILYIIVASFCALYIPETIFHAKAEENASGWRYFIEDGKAVVAGYEDITVQKLIIPDTLGGAWVVALAEGAFADHIALKEIFIPAAVSVIPESAFEGTFPVICAPNGTEAMHFAKRRDLVWRNTSAFDFFEDILDLSEMKTSQFSLSGRTAVISAPYAGLLSAGKRVYLPPVKGYVNGLPIEVRSVAPTGDAVAITFAELSVTETLCSYTVEDVPLMPDPYGTVIYAEGVHLDVPRGSISAGIGSELKFQVDIELGDNWQLTGDMKIKPEYKASVAYHWLGLDEVKLEGKVTSGFELELSHGETDETDESIAPQEEILIACVPMLTNGLLSAFLDLKLAVEFDGAVSVVYETVTSDNISWTPEKGLRKTKDSEVLNFLVEGKASTGVFAKTAITISFGFYAVTLDVIEFYGKYGAEISAKTDSDKIGCIDLELKKCTSVGIKIGLLNLKEITPAIDLTLYNETVNLGLVHFEVGKGLVSQCTNDGERYYVGFHTGTSQKIQSQAVERGKHAAKPSDPVRSGYVFTGWYKDADCTQSWNFSEDFVLADMTLYAGWRSTGTAGGGNNTQNSGSAYSSNNFSYSVSGGQVTITGYTGDRTSGSVVTISIPDYIEGYPVTRVGSGAFSGVKNIRSVRLPNTLKIIDDYAFVSSDIKSVVIPFGVTRIGVGAFISCVKLESVVLPDGLITIDDNAFTNCTSLRSVHIPDTVTHIGRNAFNSCKKLTKINYPLQLKTTVNSAGVFTGTNISWVEIPEGITTINRLLEGSCLDLTHLNLPSTLKRIEDYAFSSNQMPSINIPEGVTHIGNFAFAGCEAESIVLPGTVKSIGSNAFVGNNARTLILPEGIGNVDAIAFYMDDLNTVFFPKEMGTFDPLAFASGYNWKYAYVPGFDSKAAKYVETNYPHVEILLDPELFCTVNLLDEWGTVTDVIYADVGEKIPAPAEPQRAGYIFNGWRTKDGNELWDFSMDLAPAGTLDLCATWIHSPNGFSYVNRNGDVYITKYTGTQTVITLPETINGRTVVGVGDGAIPSFVHRVTIPATVTDIYEKAFIWASSLNTILVAEGNPKYYSENGVLYDEDGTLVCFPQSKSMASFTVPSGVKAIAERGFYKVNNLHTLVLPAGLTEIGDYGIYACKNLRNIRFAEDPDRIGAMCLLACNDELRITGPVEAENLIKQADAYYLSYNEYTVRYMKGTDLLMAAQVRAGDYVVCLNAPDDAGISFAGWSVSIGGNLWNFSTEKMPQEDIVLYAVWQEDFQIEEVDGGVHIIAYTGRKTTVEIPAVIDGENVISIAADAFPDKSVTISGDKGSVAEAYALAQGMTFVPWTYRVVFRSNGGKNVGQQILCATDKVTEPETQRTGYQLMGWYTDAELEILWDFENDVMPAGNLTLYAGWNKIDENAAEVPFTFESLENGVAINGYTGTAVDVLIPEYINDEPVTAIAAYAFYGNKTIQTMQIPHSVLNIGEAAFAESSISDVQISGAASIGARAFADCVELRTVILPNGIREVGEGAFLNCASLVSIALPESLRVLSAKVFSGCLFLSDVTMPAYLERIEEYAFSGCAALKNVYLGSAVEAVETTAFDGCTKLETIQVDDANLYYTSWNGVLFSADGTRLLLYPQGKQEQEYVIPEGVVSLDEHAMANSQMHSLILPASLITIGTDALRNNRYLSGIQFAEEGNLAVIGAHAFDGCLALKEISIPQTVTELQMYAFANTGLLSATIMKTDIIIGQAAFGGCNSLTIYGTRESEPETYANLYDIRFIDPNVDIPVTSISLSENMSIEPDEEKQLVPELMPENTTERTVYWRSEDPSVAVVDENGMVTGINEGETIISVTAANGSYASCIVKVGRPMIMPEKIVLSHSEMEVPNGSMTPVHFTFYPDSAVSQSVTWTVADESVAIYANGCVIALNEGTTTLTAETENGLSAVCSITVYRVMGRVDLALPNSLTVVEEEAFAGLNLRVVRCPEGMETIGARAFADCALLREIAIPATVMNINETAFDGCGVITVFGSAGSVAESFAIEHGWPFYEDR